MPKLAEALIERKRLTEHYARLCARAEANAKVQEGDTPDEQPTALLAEAAEALQEIKRLVIQINRTNYQAMLPGEPATTLMEAIAERDRLRAERAMLERLGNAARLDMGRSGFAVTRSEIKWRSTVDVADVQKQIDALSKAYRQLDTRIQEANWLVDLLQD